MHKNIKLKNPLCIAFPELEPIPLSPPICDVVCNKICGNILLDNQVMNLEIWKKEIIGEATVSVSVFNSIISNSSIEVTVIRNIGSSVELVIPPGNTLSTIVNNVRSVIVAHEDIGIIEGKYCLEVCFSISCL
ncbi:S-Ena type endospore appendage [Bacillus mycoides]